jgi:hypothetical protein
MTSGRSDDCRSLRRGLIATAAVESPRRKRRRSRIPRALVRVPIQHGTMTSGRSDDCGSLRRGLIATAAVESPRRKRRRSRIPRALVRVPIKHRGTMTKRPWGVRFRTPGGKRTLPAPWLERCRRFGGKRTLPMPVFARRTAARAHFTLRGPMAENGTRGLREDHGDD